MSARCLTVPSPCNSSVSCCWLIESWQNNVCRLDLKSNQGVLGTLAALDTRNPILYINFPQGRLKLRGTILCPKTKILCLAPPTGASAFQLRGVFDSVVVFPQYDWIGTAQDNPSEQPLDEMPESLFVPQAGIAGASSSAQPATPSADASLDGVAGLSSRGAESAVDTALEAAAATSTSTSAARRRAAGSVDETSHLSQSQSSAKTDEAVAARPSRAATKRSYREVVEVEESDSDGDETAEPKQAAGASGANQDEDDIDDGAFGVKRPFKRTSVFDLDD